METCGFEIDTANVYTAGTGIRLGTAHKVQAHKNTILLQDEEKGKTGIRLSGTADAWLRCNTVIGPAMAPYSVDSYGFDAVGASVFYLNTNRLPPGIYYCSIKGQGTVNKATKLVIIR
ncbi:MAG: hypothetical protein H6559_03515 [Lewinellaceae bacterium]|nr:hypothetical protein [Lewinellaceae bacterium]